MASRVPKLSGSTEPTGWNLQDVRLINRAVVFRTIRDAGTISRAELAKVTGLNPATVTHITRELIEQGLVEEAGLGQSRGGRPPSLLHIRTDAGYVVAIQLERRLIEGMITDLGYKVATQEKVSASHLGDPAEITLPALLDLVRSLIAKSGLERRQILGIGMSAPGPLDARSGVLLSPPNFPGWPSTPLRQIVRDTFGFPTFLDRNANACTLAEKWFGAARDMENFVYLLVDAGVGGGVFINGGIYRGNRDIASEIGHASIDFNGPRCDCGNYGCLELYASPQVVERSVRQAIRTGWKGLVTEMVGGCVDHVSFEVVARAAHQGDAVCLEALQGVARALGAGIVNVVNLFDPEAVIIGGRISLVEDLIVDQLQDAVNERSLIGGSQLVPVIFSELKSEAPIIGAFSLVLRELFQNPDFRFASRRSAAP
jgi:N-acetylglucosamine repressor